jgi:hypothetical protein
MEFYSPFLGRPFSDWEITKGAGNLEEGLRSSIKLNNTDAQKLKDNFEAMHNFRQSESGFWSENHQSNEQMRDALNRAIKLDPENKFFPWYAKNGSPVPDSNPENF